MAWRDRSNVICRRALLIGLAVATGCAHSQSDLQDRLSQRVSLAEASEARSSSKAAVNCRPTRVERRRSAAGRRAATN